MLLTPVIAPRIIGSIADTTPKLTPSSEAPVKSSHFVKDPQVLFYAKGPVEDAHVLEADEMGDDLVRIDVYRGADFLFLHTSRLKRLCASSADTRRVRCPLSE